MKYGYVRVSSREQNIDRQMTAMKEQGVAKENIFVDRATGRNFDRKGYRILHDSIHGERCKTPPLPEILRVAFDPPGPPGDERHLRREQTGQAAGRAGKAGVLHPHRSCRHDQGTASVGGRDDGFAQLGQDPVRGRLLLGKEDHEAPFLPEFIQLLQRERIRQIHDDVLDAALEKRKPPRGRERGGDDEKWFTGHKESKEHRVHEGSVMRTEHDLFSGTKRFLQAGKAKFHPVYQLQSALQKTLQHPHHLILCRFAKFSAFGIMR